MRRKDKADEQRVERRRRTNLDLESPSQTRVQIPTILIVCEGENTEPSYFRQFRLQTARIKLVGEGYNTKSLVERAIQLRAELDYDEVWVVFDKDSNSAQIFNDAIQMAEQEGFGIAWSNQAFEYWLLLHFDDHQGGGISRYDYDAKINGYLTPLGASYDYQKSKIVDRTFFALLDGFDPATNKSRVQLAIDRAGRIHGQCQKDGTSPAESESCTTVYKLVKRFMKYR